MKPRILLTGKDGQVGAELARVLAPTSELLAPGRGEVDLAKPPELRRAIADFRPNIVLNAAAYTAVDQAESDEAAARAANAEAPRTMAEEAARVGAALVHYSTDYVFDGSARSPYSEDDPTNPLGAYGRTKLAGEQAIASACDRYLILRTAWVYGTRGKNFLLTILRLASQRAELRIVADQTGAPTWSREIARATAKMIAEDWDRSGGREPFATTRGIYHLTAGGQCSWCDFANAILEEARSVPAETPWLSAATGGKPFVAQRITPITTAEYPTPARRPAYSVLSNAKVERVFGVHMPDWRAQLHACVASGQSL